MSTYKVAELQGAKLDAAVAKAQLGTLVGHSWSVEGGSGEPERFTIGFGVFAPSQDWRAGGAIIDLEQISLVSPDLRQHPSEWAAEILGTLSGEWQRASATGPTPLIAAMRAFVASKFGDEVAVP